MNKQRTKNLKLNLGCGDQTYKGYINVDKVKVKNSDLVCDLEKPLPFADNSVVETRAEHILEHITNFTQLMEEIHRISKPNARLYVLAPYYKYEGSYRDPQHVRFFTEHSFDYFQEGVKFSHYSPARFEVLKVRKRVRFLSDVKNFRKKFMAAIPDFLRPALDLVFWNIYSEVEYEMRVIK